MRRRISSPARRALTALAGFAALSPLLRAAAPEPVADELLHDIAATAHALHEKVPAARCLAFWDFDGTILKGDCSEGFAENGRPIYPGLAEVMIEHGFASGYQAPRGFAAFWHDYRTMDERVGHWLAYPYIAQMLAGARADDVVRLAGEHFDRTLGRYVFATSRRVLDGLAAIGVEDHVLSASPEVFVLGARTTLGLPTERIHGIRVRIVDGRLTHELVYPVTFADGKRERLEAIVAAAQRETPDRPVFVIAAFGNSYSTDSAFLAFTARQQLPAGHPVAVMFNGGEEPEPYRSLFRRVTIDAIVGGP